MQYRRATALERDLADAVTESMATVHERFGGVDVLVIDAGWSTRSRIGGTAPRWPRNSRRR